VRRAGANNPILAVHDVGAGGLSNALPELVHGAGRGARIDLAAIPVLDSSMSPLEICATSRRKDTCWRSSRIAWTSLRLCANASVVRTRCSE